MDFVDWCDQVLNKLIEVRSSPEALQHGCVYDHWLAAALFGEEETRRSAYWESTRRRGLLGSLDVLGDFDLISKDRTGQVFMLDVTPLGRERAGKMSTLWQGIFAAAPQPDSARLLRLVNRLSQGTAPDHAWLEDVSRDRFPELGWADERARAAAVGDLEQFGFVKSFPKQSGDLTATYRGLVWETRRALAAEPEMGHVLFLDIVGYSKLPMDQQSTVVRQLEESVRATEEFRSAQAGRKLISLPTGDGVALVFFDKLTAHVLCAMELSRRLKNYPELKLRMGISSGPVYRVVDVNTNPNVQGGGINMAQRVMDCGDAGHILLSKAVADNLRQLGGWDDRLFDLGEAEVKHGVKIHIFNLVDGDTGNPRPPTKISSPSTHPAQTQHTQTGPRLKVDVRHEIERALGERVDFRLTVTLTNVGSVTVRDYRVDIEFPNAFLNQSTIYDLEVAEKRTPTHRFFRVLPKHHRNQELLPDDALRVFTIDYLNTGPVAGSDAMNEELRVKVYAGDTLARQVVMPMSEIAEFFGS